MAHAGYSTEPEINGGVCHVAVITEKPGQQFRDEYQYASRSFCQAIKIVQRI